MKHLLRLLVRLSLKCSSRGCGWEWRDLEGGGEEEESKRCDKLARRRRRE